MFATKRERKEEICAQHVCLPEGQLIAALLLCSVVGSNSPIGLKVAKWLVS